MFAWALRWQASGGNLPFLSISCCAVATETGVQLSGAEYAVEDAEAQLLKWKAIANRYGVENVQLRIVHDDDCAESRPNWYRLWEFGKRHFIEGASIGPGKLQERLERGDETVQIDCTFADRC